MKPIGLEWLRRFPPARGLFTTTDRQDLSGRLAVFLLLLFAFAAWYKTGLANVALATLGLLFLLDLPGHWQGLRKDPALWLLVAGLLLTTLLAWRATLLFPAFAAQQWSSLTVWLRPLLFIVIAWWLRGDARLARWLLVAAALGLALGILNRADGDDLQAMMALSKGNFGYTARADFGFTGLGLAFLASVVLLGLVSFHQEIKAISLEGLPGSGLGWGLWLLGVGFFGTLLVVIQARGAALGLALLIILAMLHRLVSRRRAGSPWTGPKVAKYFVTALLVLSLSGAIFWISGDRFASDVRTLMHPDLEMHYSYQSSTGTRLNLYRIGIALIQERPLLGWGPGTSATRDLVPARVLDFAALDLDQVPAWAHLHSTPLEILVRFGLAGGVYGLLCIAILIQSYREMHRRVSDPPLLQFLVLGGLMTAFFSLYEFRLIHVDLGFFFILFFGILYSFRLRPPPPGDEVSAEA